MNILVSCTLDMLKVEKFLFFQQIQFCWDIGIKLWQLFIREKAFQNFIKSRGKKFDIIITSVFVCNFVYGISYMWDIPFIKMCPFGGKKWMDEWVGNPSPYAYLSPIFSDYGDRINFWQRTLHTFSEIYIKLGRIFYAMPQHVAILRKYFNPSKIT